MGLVSIYIDKQRIREGHPQPIVVDDRKGQVHKLAGVEVNGPSRLIYMKDHPCGSCLWIEADAEDVRCSPDEPLKPGNFTPDEDKPTPASNRLLDKPAFTVYREGEPRTGEQDTYWNYESFHDGKGDIFSRDLGEDQPGWFKVMQVGDVLVVGEGTPLADYLVTISD